MSLPGEILNLFVEMMVNKLNEIYKSLYEFKESMLGEIEVLAAQLDKVRDEDDKLVYPSKGYSISVDGAVSGLSREKNSFYVSRGAILSTKQQAEEMLIIQNKLFFLSHLKQKFDPGFVADFRDFKQQKYAFYYRSDKKNWGLKIYYHIEIPQIYFSELATREANEYLNKHYPDGWPC